MIDIKDNPSLVSYSNTVTEIKPETLEKVKYSKFGLVLDILLESLWIFAILFVFTYLKINKETLGGFGGIMVLYFVMFFVVVSVFFGVFGFFTSEKIIIKLKNNNEKIPKLLKFQHILSSLIFYSTLSLMVSLIVLLPLSFIKDIRNISEVYGRIIFAIPFILSLYIFLKHHFREIFKQN